MHMVLTNFLCHLLFAGIVPTRHPVDPEKSNRVLGFPALITSLCQFYGVLVTPSKVIKTPINRAFMKKYCAPQTGAGRDTTAAWGWPAAGNKCTPVTSRVHLSSSTKRLECCLRPVVDQQATKSKAKGKQKY